MKRYSYSIITLLLAAVVIVLISTRYKQGTTQEPNYPQILIDADSAIMKGKYDVCDSLLKRYDKTRDISDEEIVRYRQLLSMTRKFNSETISLKDLALVDTLCSFYRDFGTIDKYVRTQLFRSDIERMAGDYSTALKTCLEAKDKLEAASATKSTLYGWILNCVGDIYFTQKLYSDCKSYYRELYSLAVQRNDTLRMAFGSYQMGIVHTIEGEADSTINYYKKCIALSEGIAAADRVRAFAVHGLCDIYIQTEQFDKAFAIMPRDEMNESNWAYWHYGQHHTDSAIYYFRNRLGRMGPVCDVEYLRILTQLEQERGNTTQALADYQALMAAEDSVKAQSQAEATRQVATLHEYETIVAERNAMASRNHQLTRAIVIGLAVIVVALMGFAVWRLKRRRNRRRRQLQLLAIQQQPQVAGTEEQQKALETSDIYRRLTAATPGVRRQLSDAEWLWLGEQLDALHHDMGQRLQQMARLSSTELRLCYLIRLGLTPTEMADVLCKSVSAISHARYRMSKKILGDKAALNNLTELIMRF